MSNLYGAKLKEKGLVPKTFIITCFSEHLLSQIVSNFAQEASAEKGQNSFALNL